jgi:rare lipoprotein A
MTRLFGALFAAALLVQGCTHGRAVVHPAAGLPARGDQSGGPAGGRNARELPPPEAPGADGPGQRGKASYYGAALQGHKTANGARFDRRALTAAHRTLPFGTRVRVTNLGNGRQVVVRINDRGPYAGGRIIDLSEEAARRLDCLAQGVVEVRIERIEGGAGRAASR